jgi:predicted KAP-like P-loop ATPase
MARKTLNRKELREEGETAERLETAEEEKQKKGPVKKKPKRKSRAKAAKGVRLKAFWGVFNQSLRRVGLYEYSQRKQAEKAANDLSDSQKTPHFVQLVKEVIEE